MIIYLYSGMIPCSFNLLLYMSLFLSSNWLLYAAIIDGILGIKHCFLPLFYSRLCIVRLRWCCAFCQYQDKMKLCVFLEFIQSRVVLYLTIVCLTNADAPNFLTMPPFSLVPVVFGASKYMIYTFPSERIIHDIFSSNHEDSLAPNICLALI